MHATGTGCSFTLDDDSAVADLARRVLRRQGMSDTELTVDVAHAADGRYLVRVSGHLHVASADPLTAATEMAGTLDREVSHHFPVRSVRVALY